MIREIIQSKLKVDQFKSFEKSIYFLFLLSVALFMMFSEIKMKHVELSLKLNNNDKNYTRLVNTFTSQVTVNYPCKNFGRMNVILGSDYNNAASKLINLNDYPCGLDNFVNLGNSNYFEYVSFEAGEGNTVGVKFKSNYAREVSSLRKILLYTSIIVFLFSSRVHIGNIRKKFKRIDLFLLFPIFFAWIINFKYVIPNWDDGWFLVIIRNFSEFGTSNNIWARYNGIFGNWLNSILGSIHLIYDNQILFRLVELFIWLAYFLIVLATINKFYSSLNSTNNKITILLIFCTLVLSMGTTLRPEPIIGLLVSFSFYFLKGFLKNHSQSSLALTLFFSALSVTAGLSGVVALIFPAIIIYRLIKIRVNLISSLFSLINSLLFVIILFLFNSNLKIFTLDIIQTQTMTVKSHSYGVLDEWRRYVGDFGILESYDYYFKIYALVLLLSFVYTMFQLFSRNRITWNVEYKIIFISMVCLLSLTPSKWGWYVLPILGVLSVNLVQLISVGKFKYFLTLFMYTFTLWIIYTGEFWRSNPAINDKTINEFKAWNLNFKIIIFLYAFAFIAAILLDKFTNSLNFFNFALTFLLITNVLGLININALNFGKERLEENIFNWSNNSSKSCSILSRLDYNQISGRVSEDHRKFQGIIAFPQDNEQVMFQGLNRYTFAPDKQKISLEVRPDAKNNHLSLAIRGKDLSNITIQYTQGSKKISIGFLTTISDPSVWQILNPILVSNKLIKITITSTILENDFQITDPFYVKQVSTTKSVMQNYTNIFLGPEQIYLASCIESPRIRDGLFIKPDLVIGNANSGSTIFGNSYKLRIINNCWVELRKAYIDDCIVQWIH